MDHRHDDRAARVLPLEALGLGAPKPDHVVDGDRPREPLQLQFALGDRVDAVLDRVEDRGADKDLTGRSPRAQPGGEIGDAPERTVVVSALEPDPGKGGVPRGDADAESRMGRVRPRASLARL